MAAPAGPYQVLPPLTKDEYDRLKADISARGIMIPIVFDDHGNVIDGHNRLRIAEELGLEYPKTIREGLSEAEKRSLARALNTARRHLSRKQKRHIIADEIRENPAMSNNALGARLGVSDVTVGSVRDELGMYSEGTRTGADGKNYPARLTGLSGLTRKLNVRSESVIDGRSLAWRRRTKQWDDLDLPDGADTVLTEILLDWHIPAGGSVLDPFGHPSRLMVADRGGWKYTGIGHTTPMPPCYKHLADDSPARMIEGNPLGLRRLVQDVTFDGCVTELPAPQAADYEDWSDWATTTLVAASSVVAGTIVVGLPEVLDNEGFLRPTAKDLTQAMIEVGRRVRDEIVILRDQSKPVPAGHLGRVHDVVLVFA